MLKHVLVTASIVAMAVMGCKRKRSSEAEPPPAKTARTKKTAKPKVVGPPHQAARDDQPHPDGAEVRFDVAFVVDTTGSMQKLIEAARDRIRSIAGFVGTGKPKPSIRFGIVAYRDRGERYVTMTYGFSPDVSLAADALGELRAEGGKDKPEHVVAGLRQAVNGLKWDPKAKLKFLFLVGDASPHLDYGEESEIEPVLEAAKAQGVIIYSIPLGAMPDDGKMFFHKVATATGGSSEGIAAEAQLESTVTTALAEHAGKLGIQYDPGGSGSPE